MNSPETPNKASTPGRRRFGGPGWLVAAAFVGPGTVTTATLAGGNYGAALLWALLFSVLATMALQEMAARLGLATGAGLGEALRSGASGPARWASVVLVVGAIALGNAAYQTGNLLGGALGLEAAVGGPVQLWVGAVGLAAAALLWSGSYRAVERGMIALVGIMVVAFLVTAIRVLPEVSGVLPGLFRPSLPDGSVWTVVGLIGTTIVPYNLFLHASTVNERFRGGIDDLPAARRDLVISIAVGGAVSMAILVTAAGTLYGLEREVGSAADMAVALEPILGGWARWVFALGLFAAGMTSAVTAPLAAALATSGALGWQGGLKAPGTRAVWMTVLGAGILFGLTGVRPLAAILFAQAANGILLPIVAIFLLVVANDARRMKGATNGVVSNVAGVIAVLVAAGLGLRALASVVGLI